MPVPAWLADLPHSSFMALGDSLLNGMRSYSIDDTKAAASIPALVGAALQPRAGVLPFQPARYPAPILIDVEDQLRHYARSVSSTAALIDVLNALPAIKADVTQNARDWIARFDRDPGGPADTAAFDNLAIAGARIEDAFEITGGQLDARIDAMAEQVSSQSDPLTWGGNWPANDPQAGSSWGVGDVHINFNARHLRNPANRDGLDDMTVLDLVGARQPRTLLVDMGANHGLVDVVMRDRGDAGMDGLRAFAAAWPACARAIARLPGVERVIMLLLPRPSQTPCLAPPNPSPAPELEPGPTRPDHYFSRYVSALAPISAGFGYDGDTVQRFDREMDDVNATVRAGMEAAFAGSGKHLAFVSLAELLAMHDYKHRRGPMLPGTGGRGYSNYPLGEIGSLFHGSRLRGGICGLDQIHPSTIGYRFVAEAVRQALSAMDGAPGTTPIEITDAGDPFLLTPHWPTIAALDGLYPRAAAGLERLEPPHPEKEAARRLIFEADWLR